MLLTKMTTRSLLSPTTKNNKDNTMPKTRLNKEKREILLTHAIEQMKPTEQIEAVDKAYLAMHKELIKQHNRLFPENELKVFRKHGLLKKRSYIKMYITYEGRSSSHQTIELQGDDTLEMPMDGYASIPLGEFKNTTKLVKLVSQLTKKESKLGSINRQIHTDMSTLINTAKYYEDVVEVWDGAKDKESCMITQNMAVSALSDESMERIKSYQK